MAEIRNVSSTYCKNTRLGFKIKCKGVAFTINNLAKPSFKGCEDNYCIYIGYEDIEIGISTHPRLDGDKGFTWFWNYVSPQSGSVKVKGRDYGRGDGSLPKSNTVRINNVHYDFGSKIVVQLYLDSDKRLNLIINGLQVFKSPRKHNWSNTTFEGHLGTRIIDSMEQVEYKGQRITSFECTHPKQTFSNVKLFTSNGWIKVNSSNACWGLGRYHGIEVTVPPWAKKYSHGNYPIVSPNPITGDTFSVMIK